MIKFSPLFIFITSSALFSQGGTISGMVKDDKGKPLASANVILKNTVLGSATDDLGNYIIHKIPVGKPYQ